MDKLFVEATDITPRVEFDKQKNIFRIEWKSLPEDVKSFYSRLIQWVEVYSLDPNPETNLIIDFEYFNTSSSKMILLFLSKIRNIQKRGYQVQIKWFYPTQDPEIEESGEEFAEILNIPFEFIAKD